ncbi:defensin coprisin-like isoform X1 [Chrysoperla carnea]|uniref:defensin coprisin-like isoform X1 n=1 Tax=Chrysoperla carnea TaxID=189513 RepID=UPI001D079A95|nr:defensin coprisin-like isoform X1 [Chrysoperla carnea]
MNSTILICFTVIMTSAICIQAVPVNIEEPSSYPVNELQDPVAPVHGERQRRVTCDLMSVDTKWGSVNHAACAAHCLSMGGGRRGGSCSNGVCVCRF